MKQMIKYKKKTKRCYNNTKSRLLHIGNYTIIRIQNRVYLVFKAFWITCPIITVDSLFDAVVIVIHYKGTFENTLHTPVPSTLLCIMTVILEYKTYK